MKRTSVLLILILSLTAGPILAQERGITFNSWARGVFTPIVAAIGDWPDPDEETVGGALVTIPPGLADFGAGVGVHWTDTIATELEVRGFSQHVGFGIGLEIFGGAEIISFNNLGAHVWARPFGNDLLRITVGMFTDYALRGWQGHINHGFEYMVLPNVIGLRYDERDAIFQQFSQRNVFFGDNARTQGFMFSSRPIDGLFLGLGVSAPIATFNEGRNTWYRWIWTPHSTNIVYRTAQIAAGYTIPGVGFLRAQFLGGFFNVDETNAGDFVPFNPEFEGRNTEWREIINERNARFEIAFALTAVQNLLLDIGFKYHFPVTYNVGGAHFEHGKGIFAAIGVEYETGAFRIRSRFEMDALDTMDIAGGNEYRYAPGFGFRLAPAVELGSFGIHNAGWVGLDFGFQYRGDRTVNGEAYPDSSVMAVGIGAFFERNFANGLFKVGVTYTFPPWIGGSSFGAGMFSIPVIIEVSF